MGEVISYGPTDSAWRDYTPYLLSLIDRYKLKTLCDIGGGANPTLSQEDIEPRALDYTLLDISQEELNKAPAAYHKLQGDIASPDFKSDQKFDLIFSKMLAEHIPDAHQFHANVLNALSDKGIAVHFFPTLYTLPFFVNYIMPEFVSSILLRIVSPRDEYQHAKFPAYYHWCRGPSRRQLKRFTDLGYEVVEYRGFFGHSDYYNKIGFMKKLHNLKTAFLLKHPNPWFTSYAYVVLKKA